MEHIVTAIQQAALQQQMCNGVNLMGLQMPFPLGNPISFFNGGYGHSRPEAMSGQLPLNIEDLNYEDDVEDEEQSRTLFCNNLDERVSEEILYEVFLQAGPIESARIPLDNMGRQRNFGFVTYQHKIAVPFALELYQGLELFQKKITIRSQCPEKTNLSAIAQSRGRNPFCQEFASASSAINDLSGPRRARHSVHDGKQFDRAGGQHNYNSDLRRRSDSIVINRNRSRTHQQQQHHNSGGNRRSDQRYVHGRRLL